MDREQFERELTDLSWKLDPDEYDGDFEDYEEALTDKYFELMKQGLRYEFKEALHHHARTLAAKLSTLEKNSIEYRSIKCEAEECMKKAALKGCSGAAADMFLLDLGTMTEQLAYASLSLDYGFDYVENSLREEGMSYSEVEQAWVLKTELEDVLKKSGVEITPCNLVLIPV